jgi:hypothetical protein
MMGLRVQVLFVLAICVFVSVCEIELLNHHMYMNCEFVLFDVLGMWRRIKKKYNNHKKKKIVLMFWFLV